MQETDVIKIKNVSVKQIYLLKFDEKNRDRNKNDVQLIFLLNIFPVSYKMDANLKFIQIST